MTTKESLEKLWNYLISNQINKAEEQYELIHKALEELESYKKSDESKEQSSIYYYNEMRKYKRELKELKKTVMAFIDNHIAYPYDEEGNSMDCDYTKDYEALIDLMKELEEEKK